MQKDLRPILLRLALPALRQPSRWACLPAPCIDSDNHPPPTRPDDNTQIAVGCADERAYIYDLRATQAPLAVLRGASRAVSYVRWSGPDRLLAASTDSAVRLWQDPGGAGADAAAQRPAAVYRGHANQRGFVGLDARPDGRFVVGSETNAGGCGATSRGGKGAGMSD